MHEELWEHGPDRIERARRRRKDKSSRAVMIRDDVYKLIVIICLPLSAMLIWFLSTREPVYEREVAGQEPPSAQQKRKSPVRPVAKVERKAKAPEAPPLEEKAERTIEVPQAPPPEERKEEIDFRVAVSNNTVVSYKLFLQIWPEGRRRAEVEAAIRELETLQSKVEADPPPKPIVFREVPRESRTRVKVVEEKPASATGVVTDTWQSSGMQGLKRKVGEEAPDFNLPWFDTDMNISLSLHRGRKVVMLDFWATWCNICKREMPALESVYQEYKGKGVQFLGIVLDENVAQIKKTIAEKGVTYPILLDRGAKVATEVYQLAGPIPLKVIVDCEGIIRYTHVGDFPDYPPEIVFVFDELLQECPRPPVLP